MSQEQQDFSELADQIRGVKPQEAEAVPQPHAGGDNVPEDVRERPVEGASVPIDATVKPEDVEIPDSPEAVDMHPVEREDERIVALQPTPEPEADTQKKGGRKLVAAGAAGAVALVAVAALYLTNRGGDHSSEVTEPNTTPTPTATTSGPSQPEQSATTQPENPSNTVLDPSIKPLEPTQETGAAGVIAKYGTLEDHVRYNSVERLINGDAVNRLRQSTVPEVQQFMQTYVPDTYPNYSMSKITASSDVIDELYDTVIWQSKFYSQPQNFLSPDTYKAIGSLPYATHKDIENAYFNGSSTALFQKLFNTRSDYMSNAMLDELKAGNKSPSLARDLAGWTSSNYVSLDGSKAQSIQTATQTYQQYIDQYKNPTQFEGWFPPTLSSQIVGANILSVSRQQWSQEFTIDGQQELPGNEVTTMAVEIKTQTMSKGDTKPTVQDTLHIGALIPVPDGSSGNAEHLQFIVLGPGVSTSGS